MQLPLSGDEAVDALLEEFPGAQVWFSRRGVICTECGEVVWGTFRELAAYRGVEGAAFDALLGELNAFLADEP